VSLGGANQLGWTAADAARLGVTTLGDWYTSAAIVTAEEERIFRRSWSLVASVEQLPPGHYLTATIGGVPIAVWRGHDGVFRAFHNRCRHRGIALLAGEGPIGRFVTCSYHQWSYALDGTLARVPQPEQFPGLDLTQWGLQPVPLVEWHGMLFGCPSTEAAPFELATAGLAARLEPYLAQPLVEVARIDYTVGCNWKLLVENHVDVYHLWYLHQRSLAAYQHRSFRWEWLDDNWWSAEPLKEPNGSGAGLSGLLDEQRHGIGAHLLFPNLMIVTTGDYLATYDARPLAPDRTALTLRVRSTPDADADQLVASIRSFLAEDVVVCEGLQAAAGSPAFAVGPLARDHEAPIRRFHRILRRELVG
jgi:phenylpropionate dioxygenase-like ring-hydroxylating dioxygenase large terminal subunit